jgi:hypothetical protein
MPEQQQHDCRQHKTATQRLREVGLREVGLRDNDNKQTRKTTTVKRMISNQIADLAASDIACGANWPQCENDVCRHRIFLRSKMSGCLVLCL